MKLEVWGRFARHNALLPLYHILRLANLVFRQEGI